MKKISLLQLLNEFDDDINGFKRLTIPKENPKNILLISGFNDKLTLNRVKKYLEKYGISHISDNEHEINIIASNKINYKLNTSKLQSILLNAFGENSKLLNIKNKT